MSQSFVLAQTKMPRTSPSRRRTVLVTGAAGNIGSYFAARSYRRYRLRLMVRGDEKPKQIRQLRKFGDVVQGDICDLAQMEAHCRGIDTVLHLAGDASPVAKWESLLNSNIIGTYNVMWAAKKAKCRRVVYASSIHAVSGYTPGLQARTSDPVNPGDLYGVSKCFGEALGRYMAEQEGLSVIALRIGAFNPMEAAKKSDGVQMFDCWVSDRDLNQLMELCIDDEKLKFALFNGLSDNRYDRLDLSDARELLGYAPQDDLTELNPLLKPLRLRNTPHWHNNNDPRLKRKGR